MRLTAAEVKAVFAAKIDTLLSRLSIPHETSGNADEQWYWLAPLLLDFAHCTDESAAWWERESLAQIWAGAETDAEDDRWADHVREAWKTLQEVRAGTKMLGLPPDDLVSVLALVAAAGPAIATLRALARVSGEVDALRDFAVRDAAAKAGRSFLSLFNHPEVREMIRSLRDEEPYWQRVLEYAHGGGLQAVLDEYAHVLRESLGLAGQTARQIGKGVTESLIDSLTLRTAALRVDEITAPPYARMIEVKSEPMRIRFAMRFGDERSEGDAAAPASAPPATRKERVRAAFNSPFWPFVLATTSVGQEGLDFHHYCHAVMHWNLPSNPVDMEQREGRVHRYKGHAVRKNLAAAYGAEALRQTGSDAWKTAFALGRSAEENDLVPYWLFPGDAKIERHVPALPFSREVERLHGLRRALAIYRMVFGQSRQEDLIAYLLAQIPESERTGIVAKLQMDLSPPKRN